MSQFPEGYPNLAAYQDSDEEFMIYRRFGYLQSRVLLERQDSLRKLEKELDSFDEENNEDCGSTTVPNADIEDAISKRTALLDRVDLELSRYSEFWSTRLHWPN